MNSLPQKTNEQEATMSSREIAELTGKQHKAVLRDIRVMFERLYLDENMFIGEYKDGRGNAQPCFNLDFHTTATLISGYSIPARMEIMKRLEIKAIIEAIESCEIDPEEKEMFVYAIQERETGRVKIGISKDPFARVKQLQVGNPNTLEVVAYKQAEQPGYADEQEAQNKADKYHIRSEWFEGDALSVAI